jgi:arsenical pump membrane protein
LTVPIALSHAVAQTWPPFVLIAGLLLVGVVAASDRLFEAAGTLAARLPGGGLALFASLMALVIVVTVILNLDTSVVFLTPILLHAARRRHLGETAFLYGAVFMSNSASLLLPGSNLTNLLVLHGHGMGSAFAARMAPAWAAAVVVTLVVLTVWRRQDLQSRPREPIEPVAPRFGAGMVGVAGATVLVLALPNPAVPVLVLGVAVVAVQRLAGRLPLSVAARSANPALLTGLFVVAVALGWLSRVWGAPGRLMASATPIASSWIAVAVSGLVNNLPAAVLLSSRSPLHPRALLIGLDLGPNLVVTGSLSAIFWLQVAKREGASPSIRTYSAVGILLVPLSVMAALAATGALVPGSL